MDFIENVGPPVLNVGPVFEKADNSMLTIDVEGNYLFCNPGQLKPCMGACKTLSPDYERACADAVSNTFAPVPLCFPASQPVFTLNRGKIKMHELEIGDILLDASLAPTKIVGFLHRDPEISAEYLRFEIPGFPNLEISADHLVLSGDSFVAAGDANFLSAVSFDGTLISAPSTKTPAEVVTRQGAFAPLTASGTLVAGSFACSCYALPGKLGNLLSHAAANAAMWPVRAGYISFDFHTVEEYVHMLCELAELAE